MPKALKSKKQPASLISSCVVLSFQSINGTQKKLVKRPESYQAAIASVIRHFPKLDPATVEIHMKDLEVCRGEAIQITEEIWDEIRLELETIIASGSPSPLALESINGSAGPVNTRTISSVSPPAAGSSDGRAHSAMSGSLRSVAALIGQRTPVIDGSFAVHDIGFKDKQQIKKKIFITIKLSSMCGTVLLHLRVRPSTLISTIETTYRQEIDPDASNVRLIYLGERLRLFSNETVKDVGLEDGDIIYFMVPQLGGKPIIYLFPPHEMDVSVGLSVCSEWSFSPVVPIATTKRAESVRWEVCASPNGGLVERYTKREVSYLFWETQ